MFKKRNSVLQNLALLSQVGIMMLVPIAGGVLIGKWVDDRLGTAPFLLFVFLALGIGASFRNLYVLSIKKSNEYPEEISPERYVQQLKASAEKKASAEEKESAEEKASTEEKNQTADEVDPLHETENVSTSGYKPHDEKDSSL